MKKKQHKAQKKKKNEAAKKSDRNVGEIQIRLFFFEGELCQRIRDADENRSKRGRTE